MGLGQKLSVNIAPLLLRTGLAATFIWIGTPMLRTMDLTAQQTAILANADIRQPDAARPPATTPSPEIAPESQQPNTPEAPDAAADPVTPPPPVGRFADPPGRRPAGIRWTRRRGHRHPGLYRRPVRGHRPDREALGAGRADRARGRRAGRRRR